MTFFVAVRIIFFGGDMGHVVPHPNIFKGGRPPLSPLVYASDTNPSPDRNLYRRHCPDPNARIHKFIHYMAIATFAIADCHQHVCD